MIFIAHQMAILTLMAILITIDFFFLYISQGVLRVLHLPVNWITWLIGAVLIVGSALTCVFVFVQNPSLQYTFTNDALLGVFSFMVAVYGLSQWTVRHWYVFVKKRTIPFITRQSRTMLLFLLYDPGELRRQVSFPRTPARDVPTCYHKLDGQPMIEWQKRPLVRCRSKIRRKSTISTTPRPTA